MYTEKLQKFMDENNIKGELLTFEESCHSVEDAMNAAKDTPEHFIKNVCFIDKSGNLIVTIVKGEDRVDKAGIREALNISSPKIADTSQVLQNTGYPAGGVPSFGYNAKFLIDSKVMEVDYVYSGGGDTNSLVKISTEELQRANKGTVVKVRKE